MNKLLTIDIGNTNIVFGIFEETLIKKFRMQSERTLTSDEIGSFFKNVYEEINFEAVIISSVVPEIDRSMNEFCEKYLNLKPQFIDTQNVNFLKVNIDNPKQLGADRIANAVGVENLNQNIIIVDFGTATTFDVVVKGGVYEGGIIATGIKTSLDALVKKASKLTTIEIMKPTKITGKNTTLAMQSGIYFGYLGLVKEIIEGIKSEYNQEFKVIITGGLSIIFKNEKFFDRYEPDLTLNGLKLIYEKWNS